MNGREHIVPNLQRLFSMFPGGWPGFALLVLRISVAAGTVVNALVLRQHPSGWETVAVTAIVLMLCTGWLTPVACLLALATQLAALVAGLQVVSVSVGMLDALALGVLGPGAYSIDAYRFGRRTLIWPPHNPSNSQ